MITHFDFFRLAMSISRIAKKRFIAFCKGDDKTICIYASDTQIPWVVSTTPWSREEKWMPFIPAGYLTVDEMPDLNWKDCQFDCKEAKMKKKLKDITIGELYEYCTNNEFESCCECPISLLCEKLDTSCLLVSSKLFTHKELEKEIEIAYEPVGNSDKLEEY